MGDLIRIVASISATPAVLFDLNDGDPCGVTGFSAPPPPLVRANVQTMLRDGSTDAGSVFGDRSIEIDLDLYAASQDASATSLQNLARLLSDPRGQWLMYQPNGATAPVFFRTKRADIEAIEDVLSSNALRELELSIPAEPFAYGLPVSGAATITNDPTATANPMSIVFPAIQGDVASALSVRIPNEIGTISDGDAVSVLATYAADDVPVAPFWVDMSSVTLGPASQGWSKSTVSDSGAVGGSVARFTLSTAGLYTFTQYASNAIDPQCPPGDYRVYARIRASMQADLSIPNTGAAGSVDLNTFAWVDMGVARLPLRAPLDNGVGSMPLPAVDPVVSLRMDASGAGQIDADGLMFVPAGIDTAVDTCIALIGRRVRNGVTATIVLDSDLRVLYSLILGDGEYAAAATLAGSDQLRVVPGHENFLTFIRLSTPIKVSAGYTPSGDSPATLTDIEWSYFPRYLYVRPATS